MSGNKTPSGPTPAEVSRPRKRANSWRVFASDSHIDGQQFERYESNYYRFKGQINEMIEKHARLEDDHKRYRNMLSKAGERLAVKHGIANIAAHKELMIDLATTRWTVRSRPVFEPGTWTIPNDLKPWKEARLKLRVLAGRLRSIAMAVHEAADDPLLFAAIRHIDAGKKFSGLVPGLFNLAEMVQAAAEIEGKKGNRPHPPWTIEAAKLCKSFWREQTHKDAK
jgi:hypothetical protein